MQAKKEDLLALSDFEKNQSGVIKIITFLEDRLAAHRIANDSAEADKLIRGRIAEIKFLFKRLKLTDDKVVGVNHPNLRN